MCEEVHSCRVNMIYSNSCVRGKGLLGCLYSSLKSESGYSKMRKISVSAMDGVLIGRRERIHSGVLVWWICGLVCATSKELLAVVVQDSHRVKAGLLQSNSTTPF